MRPLRRPAAELLRRRLASWYRRSARPLPWRRTRDPYRIWVAETMLQQTTVAAVRPRYGRFLRRFPDLRALAAAAEGAVLKEWSGLGYYGRALRLRAAARCLVRERGGLVPDAIEPMLALPGVGRYTAAAVLSIARGQPHAVCDGNVARVLCRLRALRWDARRPAAHARLLALAQDLLDPRRPGDWNQAMMELGETICTPQSPGCAACPISAFCAARRLGLQDRLPLPGRRPRPKPLRWTCLWIERAGRVLLWKRDAEELLLKGHWGLPEAGRLPARPGEVLKTVRHAITRYGIEMTLRRARLAGRLPPQARWVRRERLRGLLVSSLWLKALPEDARRGRHGLKPAALLSIL